MNEVYIEHLVKRKSTPASIAAKVGMILVTVLAFLAMLYIPFAMVIGVALIFLDVYLFPMTDIEYEYVYMRGELDVDKIMGKQRRKEVKKCDLSTMEVFAPSNSHALDSFKNRNNSKVFDFSSKDSNVKTYTLVLHGGTSIEQVIIEPSEEMIEAIKSYAPSKVSIY